MLLRGATKFGKIRLGNGGLIENESTGGFVSNIVRSAFYVFWEIGSHFHDAVA